MKTIAIWYLVSVGFLGGAGSGGGQLSFSPPMAEKEECVRLQQIIAYRSIITRCVQINVLIANVENKTGAMK